jgi:hypothetical protein
MSNGPLAATASASVRNAGIPRTLRSFGLTGTHSNPWWIRYRKTPNDGRPSFDDAPTTAIRRASRRILSISASSATLTAPRFSARSR